MILQWPQNCKQTWYVMLQFLTPRVTMLFVFAFAVLYQMQNTRNNTFRIHCSIDLVAQAAFYANPNTMTNTSSDLETVDVLWITWVNCSFRMKAISPQPPSCLRCGCSEMAETNVFKRSLYKMMSRSAYK